MPPSRALGLSRRRLYPLPINLSSLKRRPISINKEMMAEMIR